MGERHTTIALGLAGPVLAEPHCERLAYYEAFGRQVEKAPEGDELPISIPSSLRDLGSPASPTAEFHKALMDTIAEGQFPRYYERFDARTPNIQEAEKQVSQCMRPLLTEFGDSWKPDAVVGSCAHWERNNRLMVKKMGYGVKMDWPQHLEEVQFVLSKMDVEMSVMPNELNLYLLQYRRLSKSCTATLFKVKGPAVQRELRWSGVAGYLQHMRATAIKEKTDIRKKVLMDGTPNYGSNLCAICPARSDGVCKPPAVEVGK